MKILVPVDFNQTSFSAYVYASEMADLLDAEITLLHVLNGYLNVNEPLSYEPMKTLEEAAYERLKYFALQYPVDQGVKLKRLPKEHEVRFGIPGHSISDFANDFNFDLIIMGSRDKHSIFERILLGTASSIAIKRSKCPTILVHENTRYHKPERIVFGFDNKGELDDGLEAFHKLNGLWKAQTSFVHVKTAENEDLSESRKEIIAELFEDNDVNYSFEIKSIEGKSVGKTLMDYCLNEKADMLLMVNRKQGFLDNLLDRSVSTKVAQKFHLPVMVVNE